MEAALLAGLSLKILPPRKFHRALLLAMRRDCFHRSAFVEINSTRAHESGFKLATVRGPPGTESGVHRHIGFLSPNIFHVRANFAEVNLAVRGGDKTAVRRRRAIRREIYEVQAVALRVHGSNARPSAPLGV